MGYSIATRCRSKAAQLEMLKFLEQEYTKPSVLFKTIKGKTPFDEMPDTDLSCDHGVDRIGFSYSSAVANHVRYYYFAVCNWVALKAGKTRSDFPGLATKVPYTIYDGDEEIGDEGAWPVIPPNTPNIPKGYQWATVDNNGFRPEKSPLGEYSQQTKNFGRKIASKATCLFFDRNLQKTNSLIAQELARLTIAWTRYQAEAKTKPK